MDFQRDFLFSGCNFRREDEDDFVRDRLICGLGDKQLQVSILSACASSPSSDTIDLNKALNVIRYGHQHNFILLIFHIQGFVHDCILNKCTIKVFVS